MFMFYQQQCLYQQGYFKRLYLLYSATGVRCKSRESTVTVDSVNILFSNFTKYVYKGHLKEKQNTASNKSRQVPYIELETGSVTSYV